MAKQGVREAWSLKLWVTRSTLRSLSVTTAILRRPLIVRGASVLPKIFDKQHFVAILVVDQLVHHLLGK
jgi:hypothetical protein